MRQRKPRGRPLDGWLVVDKPQGLTSTDVVNRVRRWFDAQKAGHGGTLDPLATGLLPVAFGAATKTVPYVMDGTKIYHFTLKLGEARDTDDAEGQVIETSDVRPSDDQLKAVLPAFIGDIYGPLNSVKVPVNAPPLFIALASDDPFFANAGFGLIESWKAAKRPVEFHLFEQGGHGFGMYKKETTSTGWFEAFASWLRMHGYIAK